MTIIQAIDDATLFGAAFQGPSWAAWRAFLKAAFALPMDDEERAVFQRHTGRQTTPMWPVPREVWCIAGRRAGKSRLAALLAVFAAAFRDYGAHLGPGEKATVAVIAADRQQARVVFRYVCGLLDATPMLARLVTRRTASLVELGRVVIEVATCSHRTTRGYSFAAVIADELAFWRSEFSASPDVEVLNAVRPGLATIPGSLLTGISSPYARKGALWQAFRDHYGKDGDPVLVWKAATRDMNPSVPEHVVEQALAEDESAARAEWLAEFRSDLESFVSGEAVEACVVPGRHELPPVPSLAYRSFVDPSGGSADAMTLAIAHAEERDGQAVAILDCLREVRPPFSPEAVVAEFAATLKAYGCSTVTGDRYGGEWPRERFAVHGVQYEPAEQTKSELYGATLPLLNSNRLELLDLPRLHTQLLGLERRTRTGGRDVIDHAPGAHDDVANAAAGALVLAVAEPAGQWHGLRAWVAAEYERTMAARRGPGTEIDRALAVMHPVGER